MRVLFKSFDSKMASRDKIFKIGSEFASKLGVDRLINITHSEDRDNIVLTVWYWGEEEEKPMRKAAPTMIVPPTPLPTAQETPLTEEFRQPLISNRDAPGDGGPATPAAQAEQSALDPDTSRDEQAWKKYTG